RDRALVRAILVSALRFRRTIEKIIASRLERPLPGNARSLSALLHVAAAQIVFLDVPDSAAVDIAVAQAKADPRSARFSGLVNGVLRNVVRQKTEALAQTLQSTQEAPDWMVERLQAAYGAHEAQRILEAHRKEPPVDFSVKSQPSLWAEKLGGHVLLNGSVRVDDLDMFLPVLPGFYVGEGWGEGAGASLPARAWG